MPIRAFYMTRVVGEVSKSYGVPISLLPSRWTDGLADTLRPLYLKYITDISQVNIRYSISPVYIRYISATFLVYLRYTSDISQAYLRYIPGMSLVYVRYISGISVAYLWYTLGIS